jgi:hypothetical protein
MRPPTQMGLTPLKVCTAKILALPIFQVILAQTPQEEVFRRFCSTVEREKSGSGLHDTLGDFLKRQLQLAEGHANALTTQERSLIAPLMADLRSAVNAAVCATCAGPAGHQCDARNASKDSAQITDRGLCLTFFRDLHDTQVNRLKAVIEEWGRAGDPDLTDSLRHQWGTAWTGATTQPSATNPKVGARTEFLDGGNPLARYAELQLGFSVDELDWSSLLMVPWLLAHEFVCHVQQTPEVTSMPRKLCRPACAFFEGWMDEVAYLLLQADLASGWFGSGSSEFLNRHHLDVLAAAQQFRSWRFGLPMAPQWRLGTRAAKDVLRVFEVTSSVSDETWRRKSALHQLTALSFRIQAASPSPAQLDQVVDSCWAAAARALKNDLPTRSRVLVLLGGPIDDMSNWINKLQAA